MGMVKWFWVDFRDSFIPACGDPSRPRSAAHACVGGVGMRKAVGGAVGASDGLGLFSVIDARRWVVGQGVGKVGSGAWLGDELDGSFWAS